MFFKYIKADKKIITHLKKAPLAGGIQYGNKRE